jgi:glycosyltransferase involved in cell wall biosynthesis
MINILHITPHLGGGVGTVVLNWLTKELEVKQTVRHTIACLDKNKNPMQHYRDMGMAIYDDMYKHQVLLMEWVQQADIVLLHWWNHPFLFDIMVNADWPACRLIIWNHVSALNPPYIHSDKLIEFADRFIFTSPVSYEAEEIIGLPDHLAEKLGVVWSACGTEIFEGFQKQPHHGFNIGMTGTVDYAKLHPNFVKMCADINIPEARFIICSGDSQERVKEDAIQLNVADKFEFMGRVPSILPYLAVYDVFGYPLQPKHLGTCEQAIGEAMLAGVVPVVLNNPAEKYIVEHNVTGIIANSQDEYARAIEYLYHHPQFRDQLAQNAVAAAREKYSLTRKMATWAKIFDEIMHQKKGVRAWDNRKFKSGGEVFIESLGQYGEIFNSYISAEEQGDEAALKRSEEKIIALFQSNRQWYSKNKGGVRQYLGVFPDDPYLKGWEQLLQEVVIQDIPFER